MAPILIGSVRLPPAHYNHLPPLPPPPRTFQVNEADRAATLLKKAEAGSEEGKARDQAPRRSLGFQHHEQGKAAEAMEAAEAALGLL